MSKIKVGQQWRSQKWSWVREIVDISDMQITTVRMPGRTSWHKWPRSYVLDLIDTDWVLVQEEHTCWNVSEGL